MNNQQVTPQRAHNAAPQATYPPTIYPVPDPQEHRLAAGSTAVSGRPWRSLSPWLLVAAVPAVLLLVTVTVVAVAVWQTARFPSTVSLAGRSLDRDQVTALLVQADSAFRQDAAQQLAATDDATRCFLGFPGDDRSNHTGHPTDHPADHAVTDRLWCGPARTFDTAGDQLWATVAVHQGDDGLVVPEPAHFPLAARPAHLTLLRPDGAQPGDGRDLAPLRPPAERPGIVRAIDPSDINPSRLRPPDRDNTSNSTGDDTGNDTGRGLLLGPQTAAQVTAVGTAPVHGRGADARTAAPGDEFVVLQWGPQPVFSDTVVSADADPGQPTTRYLSAPTAAVIVGATRLPLSNINRAPLIHDNTLLVSAPRGTPVFYELTDQGKSQRIDMRSGRRVPAPEFAPLYRARNYTDLDRRLTGSLTPVGGGDTVRFHLRLGRAALTPFDPDRGYAPPGKVWLAVTVTDYGTDGTALGTPRFASNAFTITPAGAAPVNAIQHTLTAFPDRLLAAVPPDTTQAILTCTWNGDVVFIGSKAAHPSVPQSVAFTIP